MTQILSESCQRDSRLELTEACGTVEENTRGLSSSLGQGGVRRAHCLGSEDNGVNAAALCPCFVCLLIQELDSQMMRDKRVTVREEIEARSRREDSRRAS